MTNNSFMHTTPYSGTNNRKKTRGRIKADSSVQSIPCFEYDERGLPTKFLGYKYITHYVN